MFAPAAIEFGVHQHPDDPASPVRARGLQRMQPEDLRGLTPLIYAHINPHSRFQLDLKERLQLDLLPVEQAG